MRQMLSVLALLAAPFGAQATPPNPAHGPLDFRLAVGGNSQWALDQGQIKQGDTIALEAHFQVPANTKGTTATLILVPANGVVSIQGGKKIGGSASANSEGTALTFNLDSFSNQGQGIIYFSYQLLGNHGSGLNGQLVVKDSNGTSLGHSALVFAYSDGSDQKQKGTVSLGGSFKVFQAQKIAIQHDPVLRADLTAADPQAIQKFKRNIDLNKESLEVDLKTGEPQE